MNKFVLSLILLIFLFYSCSNSTNFNEYDGVNLIENQDFTTGSWAINAETNSSYLDFNTTTETDTTGLSGADSSTFRRLEIFNLIPDGHFTSGVNGNWTPDTNAVIDDINLGYLHYTISDASEYISYNLNTLTVPAVAEATYSINFDSKKIDPSQYLFFSYFGSLTSYKQWTVNVGNTIFEDTISNADGDSLTTVITGDSPIFRIGGVSSSPAPPTPQEGNIDNIRISRTDLKHKVEIDLTYSNLDQDLISGTYTFSVYVRTDSDSTVLSNNIFAAESIELGIISYNGTSQDSQKIKVHRYSDVTWDNWAKVSITDSIKTYNNDTNPCLTLYISPTSLTNEADSEPGSILISYPSLTLNP